MINKINQLADILEYKITSRNHNNTHAAIIFRNAQCVFNDFRSVKIFNMTFNYLIQKFRTDNGSIKLTNTSKNIGDFKVSKGEPFTYTSPLICSHLNSV